jgi:DNA repair exonuclease SbcCD ATPase subunit
LKLNRLHINSFGCLENVSLSFYSGFHLIDGPNESGKSTLHAFIRAMLFGLDKGKSRSSKDSGYSRYLPWNGNPAYGGSLEIEENGVIYSIYRNFDSNRSTCRVFNETEHVEIASPDAFLHGLLNGLTPQLFDDTLSVSQLTAAAGRPLTDELRNHIVNLRTAGSSGIDVNAAITRLKQQKRSLHSSYSRAARNDAEELDRQIISLQRLAASSSVPSDITQLEAQKAELEELVRQYARRQKELADTQEADRLFLERHQISSEEQIGLVLKETDQIFDTLKEAGILNGTASGPRKDDEPAADGTGSTERRGAKRRRARNDDGRISTQERDSGTSDPADMLKYIPPVIMFIAGAVLFILALLILSKENHSLPLAVLLLVSGFVCMLSCCLHFFRDSDKRKHFNIDLDELYAHGITKKLLGEEEESGHADTKKSRHRPEASDMQVRLCEQRLDEIYGRFCPEGGEETILGRLNAVAGTMEDCRSRLLRLQNGGGIYDIREDAESLIENQQKLAEVNERLEKANKLAWQTERHNEELRGLLDRRDALEESLERNDRITDDIAAIDLAVNVLNELSSTSFGSLGYYLDQRTSQIAEELTDGRCTDITVGADLEITIRQDSRLVPLTQASRGTTEQIWLALRLASIEFIWPDEDMPLFLDDTMITYDDDRMTSTLRWLSDNYPGQVFIFTCHRREKKILGALSVPYKNIKL